MAKPRAYGADSILLAARETTYGTAPVDNYQPLAFKSHVRWFHIAALMSSPTPQSCLDAALAFPAKVAMPS